MSRVLLFLVCAIWLWCGSPLASASWLPSTAPEGRFADCDTLMEGFDPYATDTWQTKHFTMFHNDDSCIWWGASSNQSIFDKCRKNRYQVCVPRCGACERLIPLRRNDRCISDPSSDGGFLNICFSGLKGKADHITYTCEKLTDCQPGSGEAILTYPPCFKLDPDDPDFCPDAVGTPPQDPPCVNDPVNPCPPVAKNECEAMDPCLEPADNHHPLGHHLDCEDGETYNDFSEDPGFTSVNPKNCRSWDGENADRVGQEYCGAHYTCKPELYTEHFQHPGCVRKDTPECDVVDFDSLNNDSGEGQLIPMRNTWRGDCGVGRFGVDKADIFPSRTGCYNPEERFSHTPASIAKGFGFNPTNTGATDNLNPFTQFASDRNLDPKTVDDMDYAMSNFGTNEPGSPRDDILVEHPLCTIDRLMKAGLYDYTNFLRTDVDLRRGGIGYAIRCLNEDYGDDFDDFCREYYAPQSPPPLGQPQRNQVTRWVWNDSSKCWEEDSADSVIPEIPGEHWLPLATRFRFDPDPAVENNTLGLITGTPIIGTKHSKQHGDLGPYGFVATSNVDDGVSGPDGTKRIALFKGNKIPGRFCPEDDPNCLNLTTIPESSYDTRKWVWEWEWENGTLDEDSTILDTNIFDSPYDDIGPWDNIYNIGALADALNASTAQAEDAAKLIFDIRNQGVRQKRMECLKIYIEEYAHRGDCGQIILEGAARHIDMGHCQWAVKHRQRNVDEGVLGMRSEHFDYENMITAGWVGKQEKNNICKRQILSGDGNSPLNNDLFKFLGTGETPSSQEIIQNVEGVEVIKKLLDASNMQPDQDGIDFRRRGCPLIAPETRFWPKEYFEEICAPNLHVGAHRLTTLFSEDDLSGIIGALLASVGLDKILGEFHWLTTDIQDVRSIVTFEAPKLPTVQLTLPPVDPKPGAPTLSWSPKGSKFIKPHDAWPLHTGGAPIIPHFRFDLNNLIPGIPDEDNPCATPPFFCEPNKGVPVYLFTLVGEFLEACNCTLKELAEEMVSNPFKLIEYAGSILLGSGEGSAMENEGASDRWHDLRLIQDDDPSNDPAWYNDGDPSNDPSYSPMQFDSDQLMDTRSYIQDDWIDPGFDARDCTHTFINDAWGVPPDLGIGGFVELFERFMNDDGSAEVPAQDPQQCKDEDKRDGHICLYGGDQGRARQKCDPSAGADPTDGCPPPASGECIFQQSNATRICNNTGEVCTADSDCEYTDGKCVSAKVCPGDKENPTIPKFFGFQFADEQIGNFNFSTRLFTFIPNPFDIVGYLAGLSGSDVYAPFWCEFQIPFNPYNSVTDGMSSARNIAQITTPVLNAVYFNKNRNPNPQNRMKLEYPFVERIRNGCGPFVHRGNWQQDPHNVLAKWMIGVETQSRCEGWKGAFGKRVENPNIVSWRLPRFDYEFLHAFIQCTGPIREPMAACDTKTLVNSIRLYDVEFDLPIDPSICDDLLGKAADAFTDLASKLGKNAEDMAPVKDQEEPNPAPSQDTDNPLDGDDPNPQSDNSKNDAQDENTSMSLQEIADTVHSCSCQIDNFVKMAEAADAAIEGGKSVAEGDANTFDYIKLGANTMKFVKLIKNRDECMDIKAEVPSWSEVDDVNAFCLATTMGLFAVYTAEAVAAGSAGQLATMAEKTAMAINEFAQGDVCTGPMKHNWDFIEKQTYIDSNNVEKSMETGQFGFWCNCPEDNMWTTRCREDFCTCEQHILVTGLTIAANPVAICKDYGPFKRWLGCYYQARAKACPVLTRDISNTYPGNNLTHGYAPARWPQKIEDEE